MCIRDRQRIERLLRYAERFMDVYENPEKLLYRQLVKDMARRLKGREITDEEVNEILKEIEGDNKSSGT